MTESEFKGKKEVITMIGILVLLELISFSPYLLRLNETIGVARLLRFMVSVAIYFFLYSGFKWAKICVLGLLGISIFVSFFSSFSIFANPIIGITYIFYTVLLGGIFYRLLHSGDIIRFMWYKRYGNREVD